MKRKMAKAPGGRGGGGGAVVVSAARGAEDGWRAGGARASRRWEDAGSSTLHGVAFRDALLLGPEHERPVVGPAAAPLREKGGARGWFRDQGLQAGQGRVSKTRQKVTRSGWAHVARDGHHEAAERRDVEHAQEHRADDPEDDDEGVRRLSSAGDVKSRLGSGSARNGGPGHAPSSSSFWWR